MSLPLILRPAADHDIQATHDELEQCRAGLGARFVERLESMPEMYGLVWQDVRAARLRKFRHLVYYVVFADRIEVLAIMHGSREVLAIMHGSREASAWQSRV